MAAVVNKVAPDLFLVACFLQVATGSASSVPDRGGCMVVADLVVAFAPWRVDGKAVMSSSRFGDPFLRDRKSVV